MSLNCPRCGKLLTSATYESVALMRCPDNHGHWIPGDNLRKIVKRRQENIPQQYYEQVKQTERKVIDQRGISPDVNCPRCGTPCQKINYSYSSGIIIDHCPRGCGIWLDTGELEKIQAFSEYWDSHADEVMTQKDVWRKMQDIEKESKTHDDHRHRRRGIGGMLYSLYSRFLRE